MTLLETLCREKMGNIEETSEYNTGILKQFFNEFEKNDYINPRQFCLNWLKGQNSIFNQLSRSLVSDYYLELRNGYKTKEIFLSSLLSFKMTDFINKQYNFMIDFKSNKLLDYDINVFRDISFVTICMLINKYNPDTLYVEHIVFSCIKVALTYFTIYKDETFCINLSDIAPVAYAILKTDVEKFYSFAESYGFKYTSHSYLKRKKSMTEEQVLELIQPNDTQTDIKKKIMRWCPCGERKARRIMQQYGITMEKYIRKSYRQPENTQDS